MKRMKIVLVTFICLIMMSGAVSSLPLHRSFLFPRLNSLSNDERIFDEPPSDDVNDDYTFEPEDIELRDDAFHGSSGFHFYEWWYFDASFDNGYALQLSIRVLNVLNRQLFTTGINIYKNGIVVENSQEIYLKHQVYASDQEPIIRLDGKEVMRGHIDKETDDWIYRLTYETETIDLNLTFIGETKGWKGLTLGIGWWGVILPRAEVYGTLTLDGYEETVTGKGYHDHNWDVTALAGVNYGWYWGKIDSSNFTITWGDIKFTRITENPFMIINRKNGEYINIPMKDIFVNIFDYMFAQGRFIPGSFSLFVDTEDVRLNIDMEVLGIHHFRRFGFINYWRYHLHCTGYITVDDHTELIDETNMAEVLRFR